MPPDSNTPAGRPAADAVHWPFGPGDAFAQLRAEDHRLALIHSLPGMVVWPLVMMALAFAFQFAGGFLWALTGGPKGMLQLDTVAFAAMALAYFAFAAVMWRWLQRDGAHRGTFAFWPPRASDLLATFLVMVFMILVAGHLTLAFHEFAMLDPSLTLSGGATRDEVSNVDNFIHSNAALWSIILLTLIAAPLAEEILFRGWMLPMMVARGVPAVFAIAISALAFGLLHTPQGLMVMTSTFLLGIALGIARMATGRVTAPLLGHVANNAWAVFAVPAILQRVST